jgi:two-component system, NarL family, sensor histidine kinase BarA
MIKRIRNLRISLAAKCQILFGAAVVLIIGAALYVPWKRMDGLIQEVNLQTAEGLANQAKMEHIVRERQKLQSPDHLVETPVATTQESLPPGFVWPRLIPISPPKSLHLGRFELNALWDFSQHPALLYRDTVYQVKEGDRYQERYRLAMPLYASEEASCLQCHAGSADNPPASHPTTVPIPDMADELKLLGMVEVDIPSQVNPNQLFLNRAYILIAGVFAGTLATAVLYFITTRLILQPVRVLQETAEKVSEGDLDIRSDISTGDEFQQLSETFNTMLANLKTSDERLREINKALDLKLVQLGETNVALYESNRLKSEFLANVSHELRTPLNSILGFAELLRETVAANPDLKATRYLQNILTSGRNLLELINDLLDLAKIEAGRMDIRAEPLSLNDLFEGLINLLKPLAEAKELSIIQDVPDNVPIMQTDPTKLQQILYNLLSNAIKFSPAGGRIDMNATLQEGDNIRIQVKDHGPGIDPEQQQVIFEKFRQIDGSVTRQHSGTGLGLAISKELMSLLGGTIGVDSVPGQGATFWLMLPLKGQAGQHDLRGRIALS